jgi:hypothetical protein
MYDTCGTVTQMGTMDVGFAGLSSNGIKLKVFNVLCY